MSIVARMNLELHQLDVKTIFLSRELKDDIDMSQPEDFVMKDENKVYKLRNRCMDSKSHLGNDICNSTKLAWIRI